MGSTKKHAYNNQPTGGDAWEPQDACGGHGSDPLGPCPEFWWGGSAGRPWTAAPLSRVTENTKKNTNNNQLAGGDAWEPLGACGGHGSDPLRPRPAFWWRGQRRAALDCRSPLLGQKNTEKKPKQQSTGGRRRVGAIGSVQEGGEVTRLGPPPILVLGVGGLLPRGGGGAREQGGGGGGVRATRRRKPAGKVRAGRGGGRRR